MRDPVEWVRIELPEHRPVIDVTASCGPGEAHVWMNLYHERGAFLTVDQALELSRALRDMAAKTLDYLVTLDAKASETAGRS